jgi:hypothetical protein
MTRTVEALQHWWPRAVPFDVFIDAAANVLKESAPDLARLFPKKKKPVPTRVR